MSGESLHRQWLYHKVRVGFLNNNKNSFDPKMSAYKTVLTIDPSVGQIVGTYNCTVGMPGKYSFLLFNVSAYHCFIYKTKFPIHK